MYINNKNNSYWIVAKNRSNNKEKLIFRKDNFHGDVNVNAIDSNRINVLLDYDESYYIKDNTCYIEDTSIILDLSKKQTYNISMIRKIIEFFI